MALNKIVMGNRVLIDLTADTVTPEKLFNGTTAHSADGTVITGTASISYDDTTEIISLPEGLVDFIYEE